MTDRLPRPHAALWSALDYAGAAALIVLGALIGSNHGAVRVTFVVLGALVAAGQLAAQTRRSVAARRATERAERDAEDVRTLTNNAMSNVFSPILRLVAELLEEPDEAIRDMIRAQIVRSVVYAAALAIGPTQGVRACFFVLEHPVDGPARLVWSGQHAGRADEPKSRFVAGTERGDAAIAMVEEDSFLYCADLTVSPPPGWDEHPHVYRTFLSVPVRGVDHASGMLSVDSLIPGDLDPARDKPILLVLARLLAVTQIATQPEEERP